MNSKLYTGCRTGEFRYLEAHSKTLLVLAVIASLLFGTLLLIISSHPAYAFTGSGGTFDSSALYGQVSYDSDGTTINSYGYSSIISGIYGSGTLAGRFGITSNSTQSVSNNSNINITLVSPADNSAITQNFTNILFNLSSNETIDNCSIYLNNVLTSLVINPTTGQNNISIYNLGVSIYGWNITCMSAGESTSSESRTFTILINSNFDNDSTDLTKENIHNVTNLTFSSSGSGRIRFDTTINISTAANFNQYVKISPKRIEIDSAQLPFLDKPATLTMYDVEYDNPIILRDGVVCTTCAVVSHSLGTFIFTVAGFSTYTVVGSTSLYIFDDSDISRIYPNNTMYFYANYSNTTSNNPITGTCNISFNDGGWSSPQSMSFNSSSGLYYYATSFDHLLNSMFNVSCTPSGAGYDALSLIDDLVISSFVPDSFTRLVGEVINSSSINLSEEATVLHSGSGNVSKILIDGQSVTKSWQGYFGNITGEILLSDGNNNSLYNWELASSQGEIYATRSPSVRWNVIACANASKLLDENSFIGSGLTDGDAILNTFSNTTSFNDFYTGNTHIDSSQNCYATNMNDNTGPQSTHYSEILLTDGDNMVYTGLLDDNALGFDGRAHDFEIMVGENGHSNDNTPTIYYFYVELS